MKKHYFSLLLMLFLIMCGKSYAYWETTDGGPIGNVNSILVDSIYVYSCSNQSGIFISPDHGTNWADRNQNDTVRDFWSLAANNHVIFAGSNGWGALKSPDLGVHWSPVNIGLGSIYIYSIMASNNTLYAITDQSGIYMSTNNGALWKYIGSPDISVELHCMAVDGNNLYVGADGGNIYKTTNNGTTWDNIVPQPWGSSVKSLALSGNKIFAGTSSGIWLSTNDGVDWSDIKNGFNVPDINYLLIKGNNIYAATSGGGVYFSNNDGALWVEHNVGIPDMRVLSLAADDLYLFAGTTISSVIRDSLTAFVYPELLAPELLKPENNSINVDVAPKLTWNKSDAAISYHIQIATDTDFVNIVQEKNGWTNQIFPVDSLVNGIDYFWHIAAVDVKNAEKWSATWKFTTIFELKTPVLIYPHNDTVYGVKPIHDSVTFFWHPTPGAVLYTLQVSPDSDFTLELVNTGNILDTTASSVILDTGIKYYWRIIAEDANGKTLKSEVWYFRVGNDTDVEDIINAGQSKILLNAYPNPSSGQLFIEYYLARDGVISIKLTDILGNNLGQVYDGFQSTGAYQFTYNLYSLPAGLYNLSISQGMSRSSKQVIVIK